MPQGDAQGSQPEASQVLTPEKRSLSPLACSVPEALSGRKTTTVRNMGYQVISLTEGKFNKSRLQVNSFHCLKNDQK